MHLLRGLAGGGWGLCLATVWECLSSAPSRPASAPLSACQALAQCKNHNMSLQSGHLRLGPDTFSSCLGFIYAIYLFCAGGPPLFLVVLLCCVIVVQLTPFILQGDVRRANLFSFENVLFP